MDPAFEAILKKFPETKHFLYDSPLEGSPLGLEKKLAGVRERGTLTKADIEALMDDTFWGFSQWWNIDVLKTADALSGVRFEFDKLPRQKVEGRVLHELKENFHGDIERIALLLRFVHPVEYALLSQPTRFVLNLRQMPDRIKEYRDYMSQLRRLRDSYGCGRAADVDIVLWTAFKRTHDERWTRRHGEDASCRDFLDGSEQLLNERVPNIVGQLWKKGRQLELARSMVEVNHRLAGKIARESFEEELLSAAKRLGLKIPAKEGRIAAVMKTLGLRGTPGSEWRRRASDAWDVLNACCHPVGDGEFEPSPADVLEAIRIAMETRASLAS